MMKIISRGQIPVPVIPAFNSCTFPCIQKLSSGRWLATFKASEKKGDCSFMQAVLCWSDDEGLTWSTPEEPVILPDIGGIPGQSRIAYTLPLANKSILMVLNWVDCSDTKLPYYDPVEETLKDTRIFYCFSNDEGLTWSDPQLMQMEGINDPVPLTGPPLLLQDGTIACQFEINKSIGDTTKWVHKSAMIFSEDGGHTWGRPVIITNEPDRYYWDQRPQVLGDGQSILNFFWTLDGKANQYINIHASLSKDGGKQWNPLWDTGIYGQPGQPAVLDDGRLATIEINRSVQPVISVRIMQDPCDIAAAVSYVIYNAPLPAQDSVSMTMNEAWDEMVKFSVGHPNLISLGNNELLAYYYAGEHADKTNIEFVRIAF